MASDQSPAFFLDRDGTICKEVGYLDQTENLELIPGAANAIRFANSKGWKVIVVSNQSGVARGFFSEDTVVKINKALQNLLENRGAKVDGFYFCPHHPEGNPPYNVDCDCRKPEIGMLIKASEDHNIDLSNSVIIGDKYSDVKAGMKLGIPGILLLTGFGKDEWNRFGQLSKEYPGYIADDLQNAIDWWFNSYLKNHPEKMPK